MKNCCATFSADEQGVCLMAAGAFVIAAPLCGYVMETMAIIV